MHRWAAYSNPFCLRSLMIMLMTGRSRLGGSNMYNNIAACASWTAKEGTCFSAHSLTLYRPAADTKLSIYRYIMGQHRLAIIRIYEYIYSPTRIHNKIKLRVSKKYIHIFEHPRALSILLITKQEHHKIYWFHRYMECTHQVCGVPDCRMHHISFLYLFPMFLVGPKMCLFEMRIFRFWIIIVCCVPKRNCVLYWLRRCIFRAWEHLENLICYIRIYTFPASRSRPGKYMMHLTQFRRRAAQDPRSCRAVLGLLYIYIYSVYLFHIYIYSI